MALVSEISSSRKRASSFVSSSARFTWPGRSGCWNWRAELIVVATLLLRPVHAGVGVLDERIRVAPVLRVEADADAGGGQELPVLDEEGRPQRVEDLLRDPRRVHHLGHAGEQQRELVPAQARYGVAFAQAGAQALRHVLDEPVAGGV